VSKVSSASPSDADLDRAREGDNDAFARLVEPLRRELHAHCYRMLGSSHDADDVLQDALVRAWRGLAGFEGRSSLRTWLYTVATRACLNAAESRSRRALPVDLGPASTEPVIADVPAAETAWLEPYADLGLGAAPTAPDARYEQREAVELAFVAMLQHLPGNQRAALVLFEVLGFSAAEIAAMMDTSVTSVNSALARARTVVSARVPPISQQQTLRQVGDERMRATVTAYARALESGDADLLVSLLTEDVTWSMPPLPHWYTGLAAVTAFAVAVPLHNCGEWRHSEMISVNGQPAVGSYLWDVTAAEFRPWSIDVFTMHGPRIREVTSFLEPSYFAAFGLPPALLHP
jgi:RNA polymerase sigma-70 factor (ECF subfamily)